VVAAPLAAERKGEAMSASVPASNDQIPTGRRKKIGIFTPCYNEEEGIAECYARVREVMETKLSTYDYEHLFIDNSSRDRTVAILKEIAGRDKRVKIIVNARNFGHTRSPHHAMLQVEGDAVVPILADLQTPPELMVEFVKHWEAGTRMVIAVRTGTEEGLFMRLARNAFYRMMERLSNIEQIRNFMGFGLYDRQVIEILRTLDEPDPYFRGLVSEIGFDKAFVEYHQPPRKHGRTRHSFFDLLELSMLALTTYSRAPLKLMTVAGVGISFLSLLFGVIYLVLKLLYWDAFPVGIVPLLVATFFFAAVQLIALGLIGEYIGLVLRYVRRFPLVIEKERVNFD
jgi:glycosyltransferase involved in cell wall biosynthesis